MKGNFVLEEFQASRIEFLKDGLSSSRYFWSLYISAICTAFIALFGGVLFQALAFILGLTALLAYVYQRNCEARADIYTVGVLLLQEQERLYNQRYEATHERNFE